MLLQYAHLTTVRRHNNIFVSNKIYYLQVYKMYTNVQKEVVNVTVDLQLRAKNNEYSDFSI